MSRYNKIEDMNMESASLNPCAICDDRELQVVIGLRKVASDNLMENLTL